LAILAFKDSVVLIFSGSPKSSETRSTSVARVSLSFIVNLPLGDQLTAMLLKHNQMYLLRIAASASRTDGESLEWTVGNRLNFLL
jgi:hypothetical protein